MVSLDAAPHYILFAGINGAGKSTLFKSGMWENGVDASSLPRVNSDEILVAHGWTWEDEASQVKAGKEAVRLIRSHFAARESFNQETALAGRSILRNIKQAHRLGYRIAIHYVGVEDPSLANARIAHRKAVGGHGVSQDVVQRRLAGSLANLVAAEPYCTKIVLYDNTALMRVVARIEAHDLSFYNLDSTVGATWHNALIEQLIVSCDEDVSKGQPL